MLSDGEIIAIVKEAGGAFADEPEQPAVRSTVVEEMVARGMNSSPAYRRLATLVRRGVLAQGEHPPHALPSYAEGKPRPEKAWIWVPTESAPARAVSVGGRPSEYAPGDLLEIIRRATSPAAPLSLRKLHKVAENSTSMSLKTAHRLLKDLIASGLVVSTTRGYHASELGADVPIDRVSVEPEATEFIKYLPLIRPELEAVGVAGANFTRLHQIFRKTYDMTAARAETILEGLVASRNLEMVMDNFRLPASGGERIDLS